MSGLFAAVGHEGQRFTSSDGKTWESAGPGKEGQILTAVAFGNGKLVAAGRYGGSNLFSVTSDGKSWNTFEKDAQYSKYLLGMLFAKDVFLGAGGDPGSVGSSAPFVMTSRDGVSWSERQAIAGKNVLRRVAWGNGRFVAVGDRGRRGVSVDGLTWDDQTGSKAVDTLVDLAFGNGVFVGVGLHGLRMSSVDGVTWSERQAGEEGEHLNSILWTGSQFVAVGLGGTYFSPDGKAWERRANVNAPLTACAGNGLYVGAAWKGRILISSDAVRWEQVYKAPQHLEAVGFGPLPGA